MYTVSQKIPDSFSCNSSKHYLIFIILGKERYQEIGQSKANSFSHLI